MLRKSQKILHILSSLQKKVIKRVLQQFERRDGDNDSSKTLVSMCSHA